MQWISWKFLQKVIWNWNIYLSVKGRIISLLLFMIIQRICTNWITRSIITKHHVTRIPKQTLLCGFWSRNNDRNARLTIFLRYHSCWGSWRIRGTLFERIRINLSDVIHAQKCYIKTREIAQRIVNVIDLLLQIRPFICSWLDRSPQ